MKTDRYYTCRGRFADNSTVRIQLFDGRFDTGYRVKSFKMFTAEPSQSNADGWGTLATMERSASADWDAGDNAQIGWTGFHTTTFGGGYDPQAIIDHDAIIVEDLYVYGNSAGDHDVNYYIELEKVTFSDATGALAMVRNKSQGADVERGPNE